MLDSLTDILRRWWQNKGFGIQSKTDFAFLHDVIREPLPYYAYDELMRLYPSASARQHVVARLLLRLANSTHPAVVHTYGRETELYHAAMLKACANVRGKHYDSEHVALHQPQIVCRLYPDTAIVVMYGHDMTPLLVLVEDINDGMLTCGNSCRCRMP